jgi:hypothetical protein
MFCCDDGNVERWNTNDITSVERTSAADKERLGVFGNAGGVRATSHLRPPDRLAATR